MAKNVPQQPSTNAPAYKNHKSITRDIILRTQNINQQKYSNLKEGKNLLLF